MHNLGLFLVLTEMLKGKTNFFGRPASKMIWDRFSQFSHEVALKFPYPLKVLAYICSPICFTEIYLSIIEELIVEYALEFI